MKKSLNGNVAKKDKERQRNGRSFKVYWLLPSHLDKVVSCSNAIITLRLAWFFVNSIKFGHKCAYWSQSDFFFKGLICKQLLNQVATIWGRVVLNAAKKQGKSSRVIKREWHWYCLCLPGTTQFYAMT